MFRYAVIGVCTVGGIVGTVKAIDYYKNKGGRKRLALWLLPVDDKVKYKPLNYSVNIGEKFIDSNDYSLVKIAFYDEVTKKFWAYIAARNEEELKSCPDKYLTKEFIDSLRNYQIKYISSTNANVIDIFAQRVMNEIDNIVIDPAMIRPVVEKMKATNPDTWQNSVGKISNLVVTGEEMKKAYPGPYFKAVHPDAPHYNMRYSETGGTYEDTESSTRVCTPGGLHGANRKDLLEKWVDNICGDKRCIIFDVDVPDNATCSFNHCKFKCNKITLTNGRSVEEFKKE